MTIKSTILIRLITNYLKAVLLFTGNSIHSQRFIDQRLLRHFRFYMLLQIPAPWYATFQVFAMLALVLYKPYLFYNASSPDSLEFCTCWHERTSSWFENSMDEMRAWFGIEMHAAPISDLTCLDSTCVDRNQHLSPYILDKSDIYSSDVIHFVHNKYHVLFKLSAE